MPDDLSALVRAALDTDASLRDLEKRAIDPLTGQRARKDLIRKLAANEVDRMPYDYHLRAVAAALNLPYKRIREAAVAQWLPLTTTDKAERAEVEYRATLEAHRPRFSKAAIERMLTVWREEWRKQNPDKQSGHHDEPAQIHDVA